MTIAIKPRQLEVFIALADQGKMIDASTALSLSQPAVSMALAELEKQVGLLFDRKSGRLQLNSRGQDLLPSAREILARLGDFQTGASQQTYLQGTLRIGASNSVGNYLVGELLGRFMELHPKIALSLQVENTQHIVEQLVNHTIDVACVEGSVYHSSLDSFAWLEDQLVICASAQHPLAHKPHLCAEDFKDTDWILRETGSATRTQTERILTQLPKGQVRLELGQIEGIKQAVIAGIGLSCLPKSATIDAVATGRLVVLPTPFLTLSRQLFVLLPKATYQGQLVKAFMESLNIEHFKK